jgi:ERCC4-type nuclease
VLVLDCVVERKTVNDLASSIVDGRYEEQKCRLQDCGVANCVYLVEGASLNPQGVRSREKGTGTGSSGGAAGGGGTINTNAIITALAATQVIYLLISSSSPLLRCSAVRRWELRQGCVAQRPAPTLTRNSLRLYRREILHLSMSSTREGWITQPPISCASTDWCSRDSSLPSHRLSSKTSGHSLSSKLTPLASSAWRR